MAARTEDYARARARAAAGEGVAAALAGAWRDEPPAAQVTDLRDVAPLLLQGGCGALAWRALGAGTGGVDPTVAESLHQAYRLHAVQAALHARSLAVILRRLQDAGIESILIKGWAMARLYPEPGLRPYGDIDLVVAPGLGSRAEEVLRDLPSDVSTPDVLDGATWAGTRWQGTGRRGDLADREWADVMTRSRVVDCGGMPVRVLGPEDHLRLAAVHAIRHGLERPIWLCDIGLLVETLPPDFDWTYCLAGSSWRTERLLRCLGLAHHLLGADLSRCPPAAARVPAWLVRTVLERWGTPPVHGPGKPFLSAIFQPLRWPAELRSRWPDGLEASLRLGAPLDDRSRLPYQVVHAVLRFGLQDPLWRLRRRIRRAMGLHTRPLPR